MKKLLFTLSISCLLLQAQPNLYAGVISIDDIISGEQSQGHKSHTANDQEVTKTSRGLVIPSSVQNTEKEPPTDNTVAEKPIINSIVAKNITPKDFLKNSNIQELEQLLKLLSTLSTKNNDDNALNANIQNLEKTLENLNSKKTLREKKPWEITVRQMVYARTSGMGDGQSQTTDVYLVKKFLNQLYKTDAIGNITSPILKRTHQIVFKSMAQCRANRLKSEIMPAYSAMIKSKSVDNFEHWDKVAEDGWGSDKYSCYRRAFTPGASVQVYLQVIKPELNLIKDIFTLVDSLNKDLFYSLSRVQVPPETETSFNKETNLSLTAIVKAYNSDRRGLDLFLFEQLHKDIKNQENLNTKIEQLKKSLLALKENPSISSLLTGQTDIRQSKILLIQDTLPELSFELDKKLKEIGQDTELSPESIFEKKDGQLFFKDSFTKKVKDAKTADEINKLLAQAKSEQHKLIAAALTNRFQSAQKNGASQEELTRYRNEMNEFLGTEYTQQFTDTSSNSSSLPTTLESPIKGKIFNIQTSLRVLNTESKQIGSVYNNDKITIIGIKWGENQTPLAYQIKMKRNRLKRAFKSETDGYVSAKYVKLDNEEDLNGLISNASTGNDAEGEVAGVGNVNSTEGEETDLTSETTNPSDPTLNYTKFEATPGKIINVDTSLRVKDRESNQIASMYSNEKIMIIGIHWKENSSEPLAYLIDLSSDTYKRRLKEGAKEEGYIPVEYAEFEDSSKLPNLKNMRDAKNKLREDLRVQNSEIEKEQKENEAKKSTVLKSIQVLNDAVINIQNYFTIEDNVFSNKATPNEKFTETLMSLHTFITNESSEEDNEVKKALTDSILVFFTESDTENKSKSTGSKIENKPKTINYSFMSNVMKEIQAKTEKLLSLSKEYLDNIGEITLTN